MPIQNILYNHGGFYRVVNNDLLYYELENNNTKLYIWVEMSGFLREMNE